MNNVLDAGDEMEIKRLNAAQVMGLEMPRNVRHHIVKSAMKVFEVSREGSVVARGFVRGNRPVGQLNKVDFVINDLSEKEKSEAVEMILDETLKRFSLVIFMTKDTYSFSDSVRLTVGTDVFDESINIYQKG